MNKNITNIIIFIILSVIIFCGGTAFAYSILSSDVGYTPKDSAWKKENGEGITNVEDAIDNLYTRTNKKILNELNVSVLATTYYTGGGDSNFAFLDSIVNNYKYFKITKLVKENSYTNFCKIYGWSAQRSAGFELSLNTEYNVNSTTDGYKYLSIFVTTTSTSNGNQARCNGYVTFYNR